VQEVAAGDYTATANEDGTGADLSASVVLDAGDDGNGAHVLITNNAAVKAWVWFRIRGRPLVTYRTTVTEAEDAASIVNQGEQSVTIDMPYQSDAGVAMEVARHTIRLYAQPNPGPVVEFFIGGDEVALLDRVLRREIGDRIGITEEVTGFTGTRGFYIQSIDLKVIGGTGVRVSWSLQPADQGNYWRNNLQGAGNVSLMIVAPGNLIGHTDAPHGDTTHLDIVHQDAVHQDAASHQDVTHQDVIHGDHIDAAAPHQDIAHLDDPHDDIFFQDITHIDAATPHYDRSHLDSPFYDTGHSDSPHNDAPHTDLPHDDGAHQDYVHHDHQDGTVHQDDIDNRPDAPHFDHFDTGVPPGYHGDSVHIDSPHFDVAHFDSGPHVDNAHLDSAHGDAPHGDDTHEDVPATHQDQPHGDIPFQDDPHDDIAHLDHVDTAHVDASFQDVPHVDSAAHGDQPHADYPHQDIVHTDYPHLDEG